MTTPKTAIVTGASSGIGLGLTTALLEHGYRVVANSRQITTAGTLTASADLALVDGDIAHPETARNLVETAVRRFGSVDLLINNAGIFIPKPFIDYTTEDFDRLVSTNLAGFLYVTQQAVRQMRAQGAGHIVNITTSTWPWKCARTAVSPDRNALTTPSGVTASVASSLAKNCVSHVTSRVRPSR